MLNLLPEDKKWLKWSFGISLCLHLVAAWFSLGFFHFDEHYQILEFAALKSGIAAAKDLPWEYEARIRPTLQPWIAHGAIEIYKKLTGTFEPFHVAAALRILSGLLGWFGGIVLTLGCMQWLRSATSRKIAIAAGAFFWILIFVHVRFSSESWSSSLFFLALGWMLISFSRRGETRPRTPWLSLFCMGLLMGLAVVCRLQAATLLPGLFLFLLVMARMPFMRLAVLGVGVLVAILFGVYLDYLFYGEWVNTAWNYYIVNIVEGKAATFGVSPWYDYFLQLWKYAGPPFAIVGTATLLFFFVRFPKHILTWTLVPFLVVHLLIGHKELRFLFPILPALPIMAAMIYQRSIAPIRVGKWYKKAGRLAVIALIAINTVKVIEVCTRPHFKEMASVKYISETYKRSSYYIVVNDKFTLWFLDGLNMSFYLPRDIIMLDMRDADDIIEYIRKSRKPVLLVWRARSGFQFEEKFKSLGDYCVPAHYDIPEWLNRYNFNGWADRTTFYRVYHCEGLGKSSSAN